MAFLGVHPAPGLGQMLPGWFVVPNNPFHPRKPVAVAAGVGDLLPMAASAASPRNVLVETAKTVGRTPGEKSSGPVVIHGLGAISTEDLNPANWSVTTWLVVGAAAFLLLSTSRRGRLQYKAAKHMAKAQYYERLAAAKSKHPVLPIAAYQSVRGV